ncbi:MULTISPECIES: hypothetical protein [Virgibacillus]|uniref:Uncharacterized protein n=2 Tax=Virgibacillus TaxID=84406 RepID=A0A024QJA5_9BACI|nr:MULTISPECIES: hypothetical protein [Virgibacillus]EQB36906.1 hypothetical protein M948_10790 [Virgibacillus sp. CM-4]MYL43084.1 hypothetical protein [Virgibacillus massiliensis]GGJ65203.1 hypothetical protein GCM10007111_28850 [Virgibacillus kapii]CDQ42006.1 hypothetical protein BN990_04385 [Virgibacillus massiliensis]
MYLNGKLISGELDLNTNDFIVKQFKQLATESNLSENQLTKIMRYLDSHPNVDGQVLTLYDQMPIFLNQEEVANVLDDLRYIQSMYQSNNE